MPDAIKRATCPRCKRSTDYLKGNPDGLRFAKNDYKQTIWKCPKPNCHQWSLWRPKNIVALGGNRND